MESGGHRELRRQRLNLCALSSLMVAEWRLPRVLTLMATADELDAAASGVTSVA